MVDRPRDSNQLHSLKACECNIKRHSPWYCSCFRNEGKCSGPPWASELVQLISPHFEVEIGIDACHVKHRFLILSRGNLTVMLAVPLAPWATIPHASRYRSTHSETCWSVCSSSQVSTLCAFHPLTLSVHAFSALVSPGVFPTFLCFGSYAKRLLLIFSMPRGRTQRLCSLRFVRGSSLLLEEFKVCSRRPCK